MDRDGLVDYLMSQSNVGMVLDSGRVGAAIARDSVTRDVSRFFDGDGAVGFRFAGSVSALRLR